MVIDISIKGEDVIRDIRQQEMKEYATKFDNVSELPFWQKKGCS